ncbi:MAG: response regulator [Planctomycetaceae bacterium]|nr:response regulator [Planctomycetaceae bacterium]
MTLRTADNDAERAESISNADAAASPASIQPQRRWRRCLPVIAIVAAASGVWVAVTAHTGGHPWAITAFALGFTTILAAYLLSIADRVVAVRRLVGEQTRQLRESHRQLQEAQHLAHLGSWEWDLRTGAVVWSDEGYRLFGVPKKSDPSVNSFLDRVHPDDRDGIYRPIRRALVQGPCDFTHRVVLPSGEIRFLHELGHVTFDDWGRPIRMVGTTQDITAMWHAERTARESEEKLRLMTANLPGVIYQLYARPNGDIGLYQVDGRLQELSGLSGTPNQLFSQLIEHLDPQDRQRFIDSTKEAIRDFKAFDFEGRFVGSSGEPTWFRAVSSPTKHQGEIVFNGLLLDIDERKRAEKATRESEERYRSLFHRSPIPLREEDYSEVKAHIDALRASGVTDFDNYLREHPDVVRQCAAKIKVLDVNQAVLDLHGATSREQLLAGLDPIFNDDTYESFRTMLLSIAEGKTTFDLEASTRTFHGGEKQILLRWAAAPGCNQSLARVYISQIDITGRRHAEKELRSYAEALRATNIALEKSRLLAEAASRAKSEFLANMSHEIRTPMTAILGYADLVAEGSQDPAVVADAAETIRRNGVYLLDIINNILDLSKIEAQKLQAEPVACSPAGIVADVASLMRLRADAKHLSLSVEFDGSIPATIRTDPVRLRQILINLIGNAIKFTDAGGVRIVTRVQTADDRRPLLQFDVIDTGIGMTERQLAQLFRPFSQGDTSTSRRFGGSGLGLSISKRLAQLLGGDIQVRSAPGRGTTFSATIEPGPIDGTLVTIAGDRRSQENGSDKCAPPPMPRLSGPVLLVEDGPDNRRLVAFLLRKAGAEVTLAENGEEAIAAISNAAMVGNPSPQPPFDVILMDMQMPVLDGYAATRQLRSMGYQGPIIALTAHAMTQDRQKCLDAGCNDYLPKPIDRRKLLEIVAQYMGAQIDPEIAVPAPADAGQACAR